MQEEIKRINPINTMNDALFKAVMCHPNNREMVVDVLHAITGISKEELKKATYIGGEEISKRKIKEKKQTTDMTVRINNQYQIIVEMNQHRNEKNLFDKNTLYAFSKIVENTPIKVQKYPKILLINIDNFNYFKTKKPIDIFYSRDDEDNRETEMYESIHLILENIRNSAYNVDNEIKKFANFLKKETTIEELEEEFKGDEKYMAAIRTVRELSTDPEFSGYYDLEEAHRQQLEAIREGSYEAGISEGVKEANMETAKRLLSKQMPLKEIQEITELPMSKIEELRQDLKKEVLSNKSNEVS